MRFALDIAAILAAVAGAVIGTFSLCNMVPPTWGILGWLASLVSLVRTLAVGRSDSRYLVTRFALAGLVTFCILFLAAMAAAQAANPQAIGGSERIIAVVLAVVGISSFGAVIWLVRT